jgi:hypothetical protein
MAIAWAFDLWLLRQTAAFAAARGALQRGQQYGDEQRDDPDDH